MFLCPADPRSPNNGSCRVQGGNGAASTPSSLPCLAQHSIRCSTFPTHCRGSPLTSDPEEGGLDWARGEGPPSQALRGPPGDKMAEGLGYNFRVQHYDRLGKGKKIRDMYLVVVGFRVERRMGRNREGGVKGLQTL